MGYLMTPEQFCYWLQGFAELSPESPTPEQWKAIREHIATVFTKVTPPVAQQQTRSKKDIEDSIRRIVDRDSKPADAWPPRTYESPFTLGPGVLPSPIC
jgi:hypothetical protein